MNSVIQLLTNIYIYVIKIELLDESNSSILTANDPNSLGGLTINTANLLQNVEKSYYKGKFLLNLPISASFCIFVG